MNDDTSPPVLVSETAMPRLTPARRMARTLWRNPWAVVAVLTLGLAGWQWAETRSKLAQTQEELTRRLADSDQASQATQVLVKQTQDLIGALQGRQSMLEAKIDESRSQQATLENLYQELARNRDEWALVEIEQGVTLAAQQLQLAGNVPGAILALQAADARLAGSSRPQFLSLRRVLGHDLDRLRALPQTDLPGMSLRLEGVIAAVDTLALLTEARLTPEVKAGTKTSSAMTSPSALNFWAPAQRLASEFWAELRGLIRIQRFDRDEPALLAPGQAFFLRENLKLRLLNTRLALLARDQSTFRSELKQAQSWIERYFDGRNAAVPVSYTHLTLPTNREV